MICGKCGKMYVHERCYNCFPSVPDPRPKESNSMKTLPELAQEVLAVQDACNLSGVVHSWSRAISSLRELMPTAGTEAINRHPINKLWAAKVADLTGLGVLSEGLLSTAWTTVSEMATSKSGPVEVEVTK